MATPPNPEDLIPPPTEINDSNKVYSIAIACLAMGVVGAIFVGLRVGLRISQRSVGADDITIIVAAVLYIAWSVFAAYANLNAGTGKPLWEVTLPELSIFWQTLLAAIFLYPAMSGSIRISILLFYRRIFGSVKTMTTTVWVLLALQVCYIIVFSVTPGFICTPLWKVAYPLEVLVFCDIDYFNANLTSVYVVSIAFDLALAIAPLVFIARLQMNRKMRLRTAVIFVVGASASVPAIYKFAIATREWKNPSMAPKEWYDYQMAYLTPWQLSYYGTTFWIPCQVEPLAALIGTSLPATRQIYYRVRGLEDPGTAQDSYHLKPSARRGTIPTGVRSLNATLHPEQDYAMLTSEFELQETRAN